MNIPKSIEKAFASLLRSKASLGADVLIRAWQTLEFDGSWKKEIDRDFPLVEVKCQPPTINDDATTCYCDCAVMCGTIGNDDKSHAVISELYGEVQRVLDMLYSQFRAGSGAEYDEFNASLAELGADFNGVGGLEMVTPVMPNEVNGINFVGTTIRVHFSRRDF